MIDISYTMGESHVVHAHVVDVHKRDKKREKCIRVEERVEILLII